MTAARLLLEHLDLLTKLDHSLPVLDLACGTGRNGLMLAEHGIPVVFADRSASALKTIGQHLTNNNLPGSTWEIDLEQPDVNPFTINNFSAVIGFRYLHRPLFPLLRAAVRRGGLIIYETFTIENLQFGRPNNPDFLLRPNELQTIFQAWEVLDYFEGVLKSPERAVAQIVARKPGS